MTTEDLAPLTGPYLRAALFCETVLVEQDNVKSIIRMVDQVTSTAIGPAAPEAFPSLPYQITMFISLKAGRAMGRSEYLIRLNPPSGIVREVGRGSINYPGGLNQGVDLIAPIQIIFEQEGIYWFDFELDGRTLTRLPLQVLYQRVIPGSAPGAS